ncbi:hypothetical protein CIPAW_14G054300 [Carya illinoinensis]|uniref:Uncharacterized protein n=1 Tax=Carya illinoinensis TaxID=32201 RepID=A0A8T1NJN6_CARIL|nr:hypothetical protein CIPAW_14G054300 [Carya illinoinensis]
MQSFHFHFYIILFISIIIACAEQIWYATYRIVCSGPCCKALRFEKPDLTLGYMLSLLFGDRESNHL